MSFTISIPHRSRDESLVDVAAHARTLGQDESRVTRQIVLSAYTDGVATTAGELIDHVAQLAPHERRAMLDRARAEVGLEATASIEGREQVEAATTMARASAHSSTQTCAAGCGAIPTNQVGAWLETNYVKWWCPAHVDQAAPGDMEQRPSPWRLSASGALVPNEPTAEARDAAGAESRDRQHEAVLAVRAVEADEMREADAAQREQMRRELPDHLKASA